MRILGVVCAVSLLMTSTAFGQRRRIDPAEWRAAQGWKTDWSSHILHPDSLTITGDRDRIPSLNRPAFETIASADGWLADREPVAVVSVNGDVRAYPIQIMMYHDVANDVVGGHPVVVTFCILCGSAMAFDRVFEGDTLEFRYAGALHHSNLVMYDLQTETLWAQAVGEGLIGTHAGKRLRFVPAPVMSFGEFKENHPGGRVLSRETGYDRDYGKGRLTDYDTSPPIARIFRWGVDERLPAKERVMVIEHGDDVAAIPYSALAEATVITPTVGGEPYVVFWGPGTASIYAERTADGRDVGAAVAYSPVVRGRRLRFEPAEEPNRFVDRETGTIWTLAGKAVDGPLTGTKLAPARHGVHFWFVWAAYRPETRVIKE